MNVSIEKKKAEAIRRMKKLGIFNQTIKQFEKENLISVSEPPFGGLYWAEEDVLQRIREFEQEYNGLVFLVVRSAMNIAGDIMEMDSYLFVSDYEEEWDMDNESIDDGYVFAYVYNRTAPFCSEMGSIVVERTSAGGLIRVG